MQIQLDVLGWRDLPSRSVIPISGRPWSPGLLPGFSPKVRSCPRHRQAGSPSSHSRQLQPPRSSRSASLPSTRGSTSCGWRRERKFPANFPGRRQGSKRKGRCASRECHHPCDLHSNAPRKTGWPFSQMRKLRLRSGKCLAHDPMTRKPWGEARFASSLSQMTPDSGRG